MEIYSLDLERYLLSGVIRHPETFAEIDGYIDSSDFHSPLHEAIFNTIRQILRNQEKLDKVLIAEKLSRISIAFEDEISSPLDYLNSITLIPVKASVVKPTAEDLKLISLRRELSHTGEEITKLMHKYPNATANELIGMADETYNKQISLWDLGKDEPENIFEDLEKILEERAKKPIEQVGFFGPHPRTNELYGSLLRPSNITTICSRAGQGKTTVMTDFCYKVSKAQNIPVIHFDNGEMLKEELQMRMAAGLTGVPFYLLETGKFAKDPECLKKVRSVMKDIKEKFFYYNVAGKSVEEMISLLRRFYMLKVGRQNPAIFCFDYIKSTSEITSLTKAEWETIGRMVTKFKDFISDEVKIPMLTAVQANRIGIHTNKEAKFVIDDESVFSGGDRTVFYSSHAFILRKKTYDELQNENERFGTHKLINVKARHLGQNVDRAQRLVQLPDGRKRNNYINLDIKNFAVQEVGDLVDMTKQIGNLDIAQKDVTDDLDWT